MMAWMLSCVVKTARVEMGNLIKQELIDTYLVIENCKKITTYNNFQKNILN